MPHNRRMLVICLSMVFADVSGGAHLHAAIKHRRGDPIRMKATAFALDERPTAAGTAPQVGIVAADPAVLPLGTRIRIAGAGLYNGIYLVTEKGAKVKGRHIDLYLPSVLEAKKFGKRAVSVYVLEKGAGRDDARQKSP